MTARDWIVGAVFGVAWLGIVMVVQAARGENTPGELGSIIAWCALLVGALLVRPSWKAVAVFLGILAGAFFLNALSGRNVLYHDPPSPYSVHMLEAVALFVGFWSTPFIVNAGAQLLRKRFAR